MGVAEHFREQGYSITWPVKPPFVEGLSRAYPNIKFDSDEHYDPNLFNIKEDKIVDGVRIIPMRWSHQILQKENKWWMRTKYDLYNLDYRTWKDHAMYVRYPEKEKELFYYLGLLPGDKFNLISKVYRSNFSGSVPFEVNNGLRNIEMKVLPAFSLFDWSMVIEEATNIHAVNSAILYLLELLSPKAKEIHLYSRVPDEVGFPYVHYLLSKEYILHE